MLKKVPLSFDPVLGYYVDLPTYAMVPHTFQPVTPLLLGANGVLEGADPVAVMALNPTVTCDLPDDYPVDGAGQLIAALMRKKYREHGRFGANGWNPPHLT